MNLLNIHEVIKTENQILKLQNTLQKTKDNEKLQNEIKMRIIVLNGRVNEKKRKME